MKKITITRFTYICCDILNNKKQNNKKKKKSNFKSNIYVKAMTSEERKKKLCIKSFSFN